MFGVLTPLLARPLSDGSLEIISGHRRARAAEAAGLTEAPVIVWKMTDDEAVVLMVDSNLQRENILPSERAFAYKTKLEAKLRSVGCHIYSMRADASTTPLKENIIHEAHYDAQLHIQGPLPTKQRPLRRREFSSL